MDKSYANRNLEAFKSICKLFQFAGKFFDSLSKLYIALTPKEPEAEPPKDPEDEAPPKDPVAAGAA